MAVTTTPRLGLNRWSSGTDLHPNRAEWDAQQAILEDKTAIDIEVATYADRPDPKRGTYMWVVDEERLYRATSTGWATTAKIGGGGRGTQIVVGPASSAVEGVSSHGARADHTHTIPLVTASADGAMAKADKVKLDAATDAATASTLARRNSTGGIKFTGVELTSAPSAPSDAIRKTDLDALSTAAVQYKTITSAKAANLATPGDYRITDEPGAFISIRPLNDTGSDVLRVRVDGVNARAVYSRSTDGGLTWKTAGTLIASTDMATSAADGLMAKADKSKLDAATSSETASTIMSRDSSGRARAANPVAAQDVATKGYTDAKATAEATAAVAAIPLVTASVDGLMRKVDKAKLDAAVSTVIANTLVLRDSSGRARVKSPLNGEDAANKSYTDSTATSAATSAVNAIPNASSSVDGHMSKADKALLDTAGYTAISNSVVQRDSGGRARFNAPVNGYDAANKAYVDAGDSNSVKVLNESIGDLDLDGITETGWYRQSLNASATAARHYPPGGELAGWLQVFTSTSMTWQIYIPYSTNSSTIFTRAKYNSSFSNWNAITANVATSSADGLMPKADKALLDGATASAVGNALVKRYGSGQIGVPATPDSANVAASKAYVDNTVEAAAEKDTGWRDITSDAVNLASGATLKVRRKGDEVTFLVNGNLNWPSSNGSSFGRRSVDIISGSTSIAGFNGSQGGDNLVPLLSDTELYATGKANYNRAGFSVISAIGGQLPKSGSKYLSFSLTRITKEDFPTKLPGTPTNL